MEDDVEWRGGVGSRGCDVPRGCGVPRGCDGPALKGLQPSSPSSPFYCWSAIWLL